MNAFKEGRDAAKDGRNEDDNPYEVENMSDAATRNADLWIEGFYSHKQTEPIRREKIEWK